MPQAEQTQNYKKSGNGILLNLSYFCCKQHAHNQI